jgi:hypothetical protein
MYQLKCDLFDLDSINQFQLECNLFDLDSINQFQSIWPCNKEERDFLLKYTATGLSGENNEEIAVFLLGKNKKR